MPKIIDPDPNGTPSRNGHSKTLPISVAERGNLLPLPPRGGRTSTHGTTTLPSDLDALIRMANAPGDDVSIGSERYTEGPDDETSSWADLAEENQKVKYLLRDWIPYGMLTGVVGEPKAGKSGFLLWAVVRPIITGCHWFTGQPASEPGYVVWCDTEHRLALNLDRAKQWGLPLDRIRLPFKDRRQVVNIDDPDHIHRIMETVCRYKAKAVILDSYRGAHRGNEDKSGSSSGLLALAGMCEETGTACPVIHHTRKMGRDEEPDMNCARGSNAFLASVVSQLVIDIPDPTPNLRDAWRRLQLLGENLGIAPDPVGFRFTPDGLEFGEAPVRGKRQQTPDEKRETVEDWLLRKVQEPGTEYPAASLLKEAEIAGYSPSAVFRGRKNLGIISLNRPAGYVWILPPDGA